MSAPGRAWAAVASGVAANLVVVVGLLALGWPGGNVVIMFVVDTLLMGAVAAAALRRAARLRRATGGPLVSWGQAPGLLLGVLVVGFVMAGVAYAAGIEATPLALGVPLLAAVARAGTDGLAVLRRPEAEAGDAARRSLLATLLRVVVIATATWLLFQFRPSGPAFVPVALGLLIGLKALLDARMSYLAGGGGGQRSDASQLRRRRPPA